MWDERAGRGDWLGFYCGCGAGTGVKACSRGLGLTPFELFTGTKGGCTLAFLAACSDVEQKGKKHWWNVEAVSSQI